MYSKVLMLDLKILEKLYFQRYIFQNNIILNFIECIVLFCFYMKLCITEGAWYGNGVVYNFIKIS